MLRESQPICFLSKMVRKQKSETRPFNRDLMTVNLVLPTKKPDFNSKILAKTRTGKTSADAPQNCHPIGASRWLGPVTHWFIQKREWAVLRHAGALVRTWELQRCRARVCTTEVSTVSKGFIRAQSYYHLTNHNMGIVSVCSLIGVC